MTFLILQKFKDAIEYTHLTYNINMGPHIKNKIIDYLPKALLGRSELLENAIKIVKERLKEDNAIRNLPQIENERDEAVRRVEEMTSLIDGWRVSGATEVPIKLKCNDGNLQLIKSLDIYWFEKTKNGIKICFLHNSQKLEEDCLGVTNLSDFDKNLDDSIFFSARNYRINLEKIKKLTKEDCLLVTLERKDGIHLLKKEIKIIKRDRQNKFLAKYIKTRNEKLKVTFEKNKNEQVMEMEKQNRSSPLFS